MDEIKANFIFSLRWYRQVRKVFFQWYAIVSYLKILTLRSLPKNKFKNIHREIFSFLKIEKI